jgi:hypothetical protein
MSFLSEVFRAYFQYHHENARMKTQTTPQSLHYTLFPLHYSPIICSFNTIQQCFPIQFQHRALRTRKIFTEHILRFLDTKITH